MSTTDNKNGIVRDRSSHFEDFNKNKSGQINSYFQDIDDHKESDNDNREIAERGYTVRNGHNPNRPNPDEDISDDDLDDLNDDFHTDRDLEDNNDDIYEVELEDENDELDNPKDELNFDFNETEDVLEDIDDDDDEDDDDDFIEEEIDEDNDYVEDDVQEDDDDEEYPENDPRKF